MSHLFTRKPWILATLALAIATLQAWDSHVLLTDAMTQILVVAAIPLPALAIALARDTRVRLAAVVAAAVLLVIARTVSSVPLPDLTLAAFFPGWIVLFDHVRMLHEPADDGAAAPR